MAQKSELRYDHSVAKLLILEAAALGFVAIGYLILTSRHGTLDTFMSSLAIGFFGLGAVVFLIQLFGRLLLRQPTLAVNDDGIVFHAFWRTLSVRWDKIRDIAIYKQTGGYRTKVYYLVMNARDPDSLPRPRARAFTARFYPSLSKAAITVPLYQLFVRGTAAKCDALLRDIYTHFAPQLSYYGIVVNGLLRSVN